MSEDKSADLLSANPQPDNVPTGDDKVGDGGVKQFLMQAWQNLAMYVAATEEPEGAAAGMMLLQGLRHLISGENLADIMGGQPGQPQQNPNDPNAAPQNPNQPQQQQMMQGQPQQQVEDPNAAPQGPQDPNQQRQVSPFGGPQQQQAPSGPSGTAPKKKSGSSSSPEKKKPAKKAAAPKKKKAATATAAMEWLLEAAADYSCAPCDRAFGTESGLRSHLKNIHAPKEI